jgi:hypothetical protein
MLMALLRWVKDASAPPFPKAAYFRDEIIVEKS